MRPDQQRMLALVLLIIAALLLACASGFMVYAIGSNQQAQTIVTFDTNTAPTDTPDDSFKQFLSGFTQALASNDSATVASETDQNNFSASHCYLSVNCSWIETYPKLQSGALTLSIQTPILFSCQRYTDAYASYAVMGTYTFNTDNINASGYAVFIFERPEQVSSWYWVRVLYDAGQCKT